MPDRFSPALTRPRRREDGEVYFGAPEDSAEPGEGLATEWLGDLDGAAPEQLPATAPEGAAPARESPPLEEEGQQ